ncbi:MAG: hypothetical protein HQK60_17965, partial [Deltaproteobacteria bacterium]|nr:hypothetical protein [Deltaproteobacteria bacterium]
MIDADDNNPVESTGDQMMESTDDQTTESTDPQPVACTGCHATNSELITGLYPMQKIVWIRFRPRGKLYAFDPVDLVLKKSDQV